MEPPPVAPPSLELASPPVAIDPSAHIVHVVLLLIFVLVACLLFQQLRGATRSSSVASKTKTSRTDAGKPNHIVAMGMGRRVVGGAGRGSSNSVVPASDAPCWSEADMPWVAASAAQLLVEAEEIAAAAASGTSGEATSSAAAAAECAASRSSCARVAEEADDAVPASDGKGDTAVMQKEGDSQAGARGAAARHSDGHGQPPKEPAREPASAKRAKPKAVVRPRLPPLPSESSRAHDLD